MSKELRTYLHRRRQMLRILALGQHAEVSAGWRRGTSYWRNWRVEEHNPVDTVGIKDPEGNVDRKFLHKSRGFAAGASNENSWQVFGVKGQGR
jgi:hypothetical protein